MSVYCSNRDSLLKTSKNMKRDRTTAASLDIDDIKPLLDIQPSRILLDGCSIVDEAAPTTIFYELDRSVTSVTKDNSSITFYQSGNLSATQSLESEAERKEKTPLFYLVHPINARFRNDTPAYFITSRTSHQVGNMRFEVGKSKLSKPSFKAFLSPDKDSSSKPLFNNDDSNRVLFSANFKVLGNRYVWMDASDTEIAIESTDGEYKRLAINLPLSEARRNALIALWCLRLWHDVNETWRAKFEALEDASGPEVYQQNYGLNKASRHTAGLTGFVGALGGGI